jgi:hypothetical protein
MTKDIAALPTTRGGMPVPYATLYLTDDGKNQADLVTTPQGLVMQCRCVFGVGRPKIGQPCLHRQRKAVAGRRCVICGRKMSPKAEAIFVGVDYNRVPGHDQEQITSIEPPAHLTCTAYSALTCPRLRSDPSQVLLAITRRYTTFQMIVTGFVGKQKQVALLPLGTPARFGALDCYVAVPDPASLHLITLQDWMATGIPEQRLHQNSVAA